MTEIQTLAFVDRSCKGKLNRKLLPHPTKGILINLKLSKQISEKST